MFWTWKPSSCTRTAVEGLHGQNALLSIYTTVFDLLVSYTHFKGNYTKLFHILVTRFNLGQVIQVHQASKGGWMRHNYTL